MPVVVSNLQDKITTSELEVQVSRVLEKAMRHTGTRDAEVSVAFVDDVYIKELNYRYRQKDKPTDVLSFALREMAQDEPELLEEEDEELLGDIVISLETAVKQAEEAGHSLEAEVNTLAVHGFLHLIGFDHCTDEEYDAMVKKQQEILSLV